MSDGKDQLEEFESRYPQWSRAEGQPFLDSLRKCQAVNEKVSKRAKRHDEVHGWGHIVDGRCALCLEEQATERVKTHDAEHSEGV